jgi:phosphoglycolate phosphatase
MAALNGATIALDLDGTLVDTAPDLLRTLNLVLAQEGVRPAPAAQFRQLVGHGARVLIERGAALSDRVFTAATLDRLVANFVGLYDADIAAESRIFPGVEDALDALAGEGALLAVCTNKPTALSVKLLNTLGLAPRFRAIIGADAVANKKPHGDHLRETIARAGGAMNRVLMVGDSATDVGAAKNAGAPVAIARFGYSDAAPESLGADVLFDHFKELPDIARQILAPL